MRHGVRNSSVFVSFLSHGVYTRWAVQNELREALHSHVPVVFVVDTDAEGRPLVSLSGVIAEAIASPPQNAPLNEDALAGLLRLDAPAIMYHRGAAFEAETVHPLLAALAAAAARRGAVTAAALSPPEHVAAYEPQHFDGSTGSAAESEAGIAGRSYKLPRPGLPSASHAHISIACGPRGVDKARFLALALQHACPRLVVKILPQGSAELGTAAAAATTRAVIALLTLDVWSNAAAYAAVAAAQKEASCPSEPGAPPRIKLLSLHDPDANRGGSADFGGYLSAQPPAPPGFFANVLSEQFERRDSKRAAMLHGLLAAVGAHAADGESGPFAPPRLPAYYSEAPIASSLAAVVAALTGAARAPDAAAGPDALAGGAGSAGAAAGPSVSPGAATCPLVVVAGGAGGMGKTTLAAAAARSPALRATFAEVLWVTIGRGADDAALRSVLVRLIEELDDQSGFAPAAKSPPFQLVGAESAAAAAGAGGASPAGPTAAVMSPASPARPSALALASSSTIAARGGAGAPSALEHVHPHAVDAAAVAVKAGSPSLDGAAVHAAATPPLPTTPTRTAGVAADAGTPLDGGASPSASVPVSPGAADSSAAGEPAKPSDMSQMKPPELAALLRRIIENAEAVCAAAASASAASAALAGEGRVNRGFLLIADDVESAAAVAVLASVLPPGCASRLLITTRKLATCAEAAATALGLTHAEAAAAAQSPVSLSAADATSRVRCEPLDVLSHADAAALLERTAGVADLRMSAADLHALVDAVGCVPLGIQVAAGALRSAIEAPGVAGAFVSDSLRAAEAASQLRHHLATAHLPRSIDLTCAALAGGRESTDVAVHRGIAAVLSRSYSSVDSEKFAMLGVFPEDAEIPVALVAVAWRMAGSVADFARCEALLSALEASSLLKRPSPGTVQLHDLAWDHARALLFEMCRLGERSSASPAVPLADTVAAACSDAGPVEDRSAHAASSTPGISLTGAVVGGAGAAPNPGTAAAHVRLTSLSILSVASTASASQVEAAALPVAGQARLLERIAAAMLPAAAVEGAVCAGELCPWWLLSFRWSRKDSDRPLLLNTAGTAAYEAAAAHASANLLRLLQASDRGAEASALLFDSRWLAATLESRGPYVLVREYEDQLRWLELQQRATAADTSSLSLEGFTDDLASQLAAVRRLTIAVTMAVPSLRRQPTQRWTLLMFGQLLGRLEPPTETDTSTGGMLLRRLHASLARAQGSVAWLRPLRATLFTTGGALKAVLAGHTAAVHAVTGLAGSGLPFASLIASAADDGGVMLWDAAEKKRIAVLSGHTRPIRFLAAAPGGRVVSASDDTTLRVWNVASGACIHVLRGHTSQVRTLTSLPDNRSIVSGGWDKTLRVWDLDTGECTHVLEGHRDKLTSVMVLDPRTLVSVAWADSSLRMWNIDSWTLRHEMSGHAEGDSLSEAIALGNGRTVVAGSATGHLYMWDAVTGIMLGELPSPPVFVSALAAFADRRRVAAGYFDRQVRILDAVARKCLALVEASAGLVFGLHVLPDDRTVVVASRDRMLRLWDVGPTEGGDDAAAGGAGGAGGIKAGPGAKAGGAAFGAKRPTGRLVALPNRHAVVSLVDNTLKLWDGLSGDCVREIGTPRFRAHCLLPLLDGRSVVAAGASGTLVRWDVDSASSSTLGQKLIGAVYCSATIPGTPLLLAGDAGGAIGTWDTASHSRLQLWTHENRIGVTQLVVMRDRITAVAAGEDAVLRVLDISRWKQLRTLEGHTGRVFALAGMPCGRRVASGSADWTVRVWDVPSGACTHVLQGHLGGLVCLAVLHGGRFIVSGCISRWVFVWDLMQAGPAVQLLKDQSAAGTAASSESAARALAGSATASPARFASAAAAAAPLPPPQLITSDIARFNMDSAILGVAALPVPPPAAMEAPERAALPPSVGRVAVATANGKVHFFDVVLPRAD